MRLIPQIILLSLLVGVPVIAQKGLKHTADEYLAKGNIDSKKKLLQSIAEEKVETPTLNYLLDELGPYVDQKKTAVRSARLFELVLDIQKDDTRDQIIRKLEEIRADREKGLKGLYDREIAKNLSLPFLKYEGDELQPPSQKEVCSELCKNASRLASLINKENLQNRAFSGKITAAWPWAIKDLVALALVNSAPFCPSLQPIAKSIGEIVKNEKRTTEKVPAVTLREFEDIVKDPALRNASDFLKEFKDSFDSDGRLSDLALGHGSVFYRLLLEATGANSPSGKANTKFAASNLENAENLRKESTKENILSNSLYNGYLVAATALTMDSVSGKLLTQIQELTDENSKRFGGYSIKETSDSDLNRGDKYRAAAARLPILELAAVLHGGSSSTDPLYKFCENFFSDKSYNWLLLHSLGTGGHLFPDGLACYYFTPAHPYVASALKILEKNGALNDKQLKGVRIMRNQLSHSLIALSKRFSGFPPHRRETPDTSVIYNNALSLLSLTTLVNKCEGMEGATPVSYGILSKSSAEKIMSRLEAGRKKKTVPTTH